MNSSRWLAGAVAVALACSLISIDVSPASARTSPARAEQDDDRLGGAAAVEKLGLRVGQIAARMGLTVPQLVRQFLTDGTLRIDELDQLVYVDPVLDAAEIGDSGASAAAVAPADAFSLHSRLGAQRVIHLDFDGHTIANTAWNSATGGSCYGDPYDSDGNPSTFSDAERNAVIGVWQRVAEDFRPFDVDVTTADPGVDALRRTSSADLAFGTRALITKSTSACPNGKTLYSSVCSDGCGGVAYVGVFDIVNSVHQPALVFVNGVGTGDKNIAEATSHEVGHNLGLSHDGTSSEGYYRGHEIWAPIMGVGYSRAVTQWSRGEYAGANQPQDDLAIMQSRGAPPRADDHGNITAAATRIFVDASGAASAAGVIGTRTDVDAFVRTVGLAGQQGILTVTARPAVKGPDLDVRIDVRNASGAVVASADPPSGPPSFDGASGLDAALAVTVPAGEYVITVDGVGAGDPSFTGYSDYASLGEYSLTTSFTPSTPPPTTTTTTSSTTTTSTVVPTTTTTQPTTTTSSTTTTSTTTTTTSPVNPKAMKASLAMTGTRSGGRVSATTLVTITDSATPARSISGAKVTGQWFVGARPVSTKSANTSNAGVAKLTSGNQTAGPPAVVKFCVTIVAKSGYTWPGGTVCSTITL